MGIGWRWRRVVLRSDVIEWHHGDEDEAEPQGIRLDPVVTRVRAAGDAGDDIDRCLTVDSGTETLVLRAAAEAERDAWLRAVGRCVEKLKSEAFDAAVVEAASPQQAPTHQLCAHTGALSCAQAQQRLALLSGEARAHAAVREGVRLLMERIYASCAVSAALDDSASDDDLSDLALVMASCLLSRQAEARLRGGERSGASEVGTEPSAYSYNVRFLRPFA